MVNLTTKLMTILIMISAFVSVTLGNNGFTDYVAKAQNATNTTNEFVNASVILDEITRILATRITYQ